MNKITSGAGLPSNMGVLELLTLSRARWRAGGRPHDHVIINRLGDHMRNAINRLEQLVRWHSWTRWPVRSLGLRPMASRIKWTRYFKRLPPLPHPSRYCTLAELYYNYRYQLIALTDTRSIVATMLYRLLFIIYSWIDTYTR